MTRLRIAQTLVDKDRPRVETSATAAPDPAPERVWVSSFASTGRGKIYGYDAGQVEAGADQPHVTIKFAMPLASFAGVGFDRLGGVFAWISSFSTQHILRHSREQLLARATTPGVEITHPSVGGALAICRFDGADNLWTGTFGNTIRKFAKASVEVTGTPAADVTLGFASGTVGLSTNDLLFDGDLNLYISQYGSGGPPSIAKLLPAQYASSDAAVVPAAILGGVGSGNTKSYTGMALDPRGDRIWVGDYNNDRVYCYSLAQLGATSADPTPLVTLTSADFLGPQSVEFDRDGNLWVSNFDSMGPKTAVRVPAASLAASGTVTADVVLNGVATPVFMAVLR